MHEKFENNILEDGDEAVSEEEPSLEGQESEVINKMKETMKALDPESFVDRDYENPPKE